MCEFMIQVAQRTEELQLATQDLELLTRENQAVHTELAACHHQVRVNGCANFPFFIFAFSWTIVCQCNLIICIDLPPPYRAKQLPERRAKPTSSASARSKPRRWPMQRGPICWPITRQCARSSEKRRKGCTRNRYVVQVLRGDLKKVWVSFPFCSLLVRPFDVVNSFVSSYGTSKYNLRR